MTWAPSTRAGSRCCQVGAVGGGHAAAERLRRQHRGLVRGLTTGWRSTVHRVMKPPSGSKAATQPRLSIPFFTGPHDDAVIECMPTCVSDENPAKYAPVSAGEHLRRKLGISNV